MENIKRLFGLALVSILLLSLILITIYSPCLAEVRTYFEPEAGKVIVKSELVADEQRGDFPPDTVIFYKIKGESECFIDLKHYDLKTRIDLIPQGMAKYKLIIDDTPFVLKFLGHDYIEDVKMGDGFLDSKLKLSLSGMVAIKILKAKSIKLILTTREAPMLQIPANMLSEWKEVIKE